MRPTANSCVRVQQIVRPQLPKTATVLVVSKGNPELLAVGAQQAWHFPQKEDGRYLGHHPTDGEQVIADLTALQARGAQYLLIPQSGFW